MFSNLPHSSSVKHTKKAEMNAGVSYRRRHFAAKTSDL